MKKDKRNKAGRKKKPKKTEKIISKWDLKFNEWRKTVREEFKAREKEGKV